MKYQIQTGSKIIVSQIKDEMDNETPSDYQYLEIELNDAGAGPYFALKTDRWAIDSVDEIYDLIGDVAKRLINE